MPEPSNYATREEFVSACVRTRQSEHGGEDTDQSVAICGSVWDNHEAPTKRQDGSFIIHQDLDGWERLIFAEVLVPDTRNVYGDFHTKKSIREFAYGFMVQGFGIDRDHDNEGREDVYVVETFIARSGDPTFIEGSWVVGMYVPNDELWQDVLDGEINGFSYEAWVTGLDVSIVLPDSRTKVGRVQADMYDGHTHDFFVVLDDDGRPIMGGTSHNSGHRHSISRHTFTDAAFEHSHIYQLVGG